MKSFLQYVNEVSSAELEKHEIDQRVEEAEDGVFDNYAFNHIFGDKLRVVIPIGKKGDIPLSEKHVENDLNKKGVEVDFNQGIVTWEEETRSGTKKRQSKLGKFLQKLAKKDAYWQQVLHWWELKKDPTKKMGDPTGVSIIISRSPIDILRMSDHKEWHSCHAPPGKRGHITQYWSAAAQEARTGGAIAYVVRNKDLKRIEDIQASEIFEDPDRKVSGVEPLERVRLRRFTVYNYKDHDELDILIPEESTYGTRHMEFLDSVENWTREVQKKYIDFDNPPDWRTAELRGGSYQDTPAANLWNSFFDTSVSGTKNTADKDEQEEFGGVSSDSLETMAQQQLDARKFKYSFVYFNVEDLEDHGAYLYYDGNVLFSFNLEDFEKVPEEGEISNWSGDKNLYNSIRDVLDFSTSDGEMRIEIHDNKVNFIIPLNTEDDGNDQLERFEHFLDWVERDIEKYYSRYWNLLRQLLFKTGYLKEWNWSQLKNFSVEYSKTGEYWITGHKMYLGDLKGIHVQNIDFDSAYRIIFPNHRFLNETIKNIFNLKIIDYSLRADPHTSIYLRNNPEGEITESFRVSLTISIDYEPNTDQYFKQIQMIDNNWNAYYARAVAWWERVKMILSTPEHASQTLSMELPEMPQKPKSIPQMEFPFMKESFRQWLENYEDKHVQRMA